MALTEVYFDSAAAGGGSGSLASPYNDLNAGIKATTFDTTNGTRCNLKGSFTLSEDLVTSMSDAVTTPAWAPSETAPVVFQGYSAVANDRGRATIDGNGSIGIVDGGTLLYGHFVDLRLTNSGATQLIHSLHYNFFIACELDTCSATIAVQIGAGSGFSDCYVHDLTGVFGIYGASYPYFNGSYLESDGCDYMIVAGDGGTIENCIVVVNQVSDIGVYSIGESAWLNHNSVYSSVAATGAGILIQAGRKLGRITNNLVEGFTGVGGAGIRFSSTNGVNTIAGGNAVYNCTTPYDITGPATPNAFDYGDNETLSASPFRGAASNDFHPVNVGNVLRGALPKTIGGGLIGSNQWVRAKGAVQPLPPGQRPVTIPVFI